VGARVVPQGHAQADERDSYGHRQRPVERLRQHREPCRRERADGEQAGSPAVEDVRAGHGKTEQDPAEDVAGSGQVEQHLDSADVAGRHEAVRCGDDVVDETGLGVDQLGQDRGRDDLDAQQRQEPDREEQVADQTEGAGRAVLTQVHARDAGEGEDGHDRLGDASGDPLVRLGGEGVGARVTDLDGDVDEPGDRGGDGCRLGETGGGDAHDVAPRPGAGPGVRWCRGR